MTEDEIKEMLKILEGDNDEKIKELMEADLVVKEVD